MFLHPTHQKLNTRKVSKKKERKENRRTHYSSLKPYSRTPRYKQQSLVSCTCLGQRESDFLSNRISPHKKKFHSKIETVLLFLKKKHLITAIQHESASPVFFSPPGEPRFEERNQRAKLHPMRSCAEIQLHLLGLRGLFF